MRAKIVNYMYVLAPMGTYLGHYDNSNGTSLTWSPSLNPAAYRENIQ